MQLTLQGSCPSHCRHPSAADAFVQGMPSQRCRRSRVRYTRRLCVFAAVLYVRCCGTPHSPWQCARLHHEGDARCPARPSQSSVPCIARHRRIASVSTTDLTSAVLALALCVLLLHIPGATCGGAYLGGHPVLELFVRLRQLRQKALHAAQHCSARLRSKSPSLGGVRRGPPRSVRRADDRDQNGAG
jgi:hypothetical protein